MFIEANYLMGTIPVELGSLKKLATLNLATNNFTGFIPHSVDLSRNNLSGKIPNGMEKLPYLQYLKLSFNELKGDVLKKELLIMQAQYPFLEIVNFVGYRRIKATIMLNRSKEGKKTSSIQGSDHSFWSSSLLKALWPNTDFNLLLQHRFQRRPNQGSSLRVDGNMDNVASASSQKPSNFEAYSETEYCN
ncbi:hypothetical protein LguiA_025842 [Lonicera macranthoides]